MKVGRWGSQVERNLARPTWWMFSCFEKWISVDSSPTERTANYSLNRRQPVDTNADRADPPKKGVRFSFSLAHLPFSSTAKILKVCLLPTCRVSKAIQGLGAGENFPFHWLPATGRAWPMAASFFNKNPLHRTNRLDDVIPSIWPSQIFPYSPFTNFLRSIWITN